MLPHRPRYTCYRVEVYLCPVEQFVPSMFGTDGPSAFLGTVLRGIYPLDSHQRAPRAHPKESSIYGFEAQDKIYVVSDPTGGHQCVCP